MQIPITGSVRHTGQHYFQNASSAPKNITTYTVPDVQDDVYEKKTDKSNNGKFDFSQAAKNFFKGVLSPVTAVIEHPIMTLATVGVTAAACSVIPVLGPILGIGFGALSAFQLGKGCYDVAKNLKNKEYDKAEQSFNTVGQGAIGTALSVAGLKQSAKVAKEAKLMQELKVTSLDAAQKEAIAAEVKSGTYLDALKENVSLVTSKTGLKATVNQFKPSNILQRGKDIINHLFTKNEVQKIKKEKVSFADTEEGARRAAMTNEEIEAEVRALYKQAFDEYGVPEELRPKLEVYSDGVNRNRGGGYIPNEHKIQINAESYREGHFDLPDVIKHEATHANEAILRQKLPMEDKEKIVVEYLLDKIQNGDKNNLLTGEGTLISGPVKFEPPKMNPQLKADFAKLAQEKLYQMTDYSSDEIVAMVKPLVENNPEFVQSYNNVDDAVNAVANYAKNHNFRYKIAINHASGFDTSNINTSLLKELTEEDRIAAIQSFKDGIDCLESNMASNGDLLGIGADFNQYHFTPEEVLASTKGNNFEISKLEAQLKQLRSQENFDVAEEARLLDLIKRCELTIEYKNKGLNMYKMQTELFNHPENAELAAGVKGMESELSQILEEINSIQGSLSYEEIQQMVKAGKTFSEIMNIKMPTTQYSVYTTMERPQLGASISIPVTTTTAADILADNIQ